jgi:hypothetical protein
LRRAKNEKQPPKRKGDPAPPVEVAQMALVNYEEVMLVEFYLHKYPIVNREQTQLEFANKPYSELITDALVNEMYTAFSGYF